MKQIIFIFALLITISIVSCKKIAQVARLLL